MAPAATDPQTADGLDRRPETRKRRTTRGRWLGLTGTTAALVASLVVTAPKAFTAGTPTGGEAITTPVSVPAGTLVGTQPWTPPVDSNANPIDGIPADTVTGVGYDRGGAQVFSMVCDGNPPSSPGWSVAEDCDPLTATGAVSVGVSGNPPGKVTLGFNQYSPVGVFRGVGPNDQFNCLAPGDDPNGSTVSVPNLPAGGTAAAIDRTVPSWGSTLPLVPGVGGGSAPCTIRIGYDLVNLSTTADRFFPLALPQEASNVPPPPRTLITVPNPNLPVTAPPASPPTTLAPSVPPTAPAGSSPAPSAPPPMPIPASTSSTTATSTATNGAGNPTSPTTSASIGQRKGITTPTTLQTPSTRTADGSPHGGGSPEVVHGRRPTQSVSSPTTVELMAAPVSSATTNSQTYWYLLTGAAICAVGVWAAELRDPGGGRDGPPSGSGPAHDS